MFVCYAKGDFNSDDWEMKRAVIKKIKCRSEIIGYSHYDLSVRQTEKDVMSEVLENRCKVKNKK